MTQKKALKKSLKSNLATLKAEYKKSKVDKHNEVLKWLYDNYESLNTEGKSALSSYKNNERYINEAEISEIAGGMSRIFDDKKTPNSKRIITEFENSALGESGLNILRTLYVMFSVSRCTDALVKRSKKSVESSFSKLFAVNDIDFSYITETLSVSEKVFSEQCRGYTEQSENTRALCRKKLGEYAREHTCGEREAALKIAQKVNISAKNICEILSVTKKHERWGTAFLTLQYALPLVFSVLVSLYFNSGYLWILVFFAHYEIIRKWIYRASASLIEPVFFPSVDIKGEVPDEGETVIALSVLLPLDGDFSLLEKKLSQLYLTSGGKNVSVCALADLRGADEPVMPGDKEIFEQARGMITRLNEKFGCDDFTCFIRMREFSHTQKTHMGRERKRGAVSDLIAYISGENIDGSIAFGNSKKLKESKYLFVADSDTSLRHNTILKLVAAALHPANKAVVDESKKRIVSGYGIFTGTVKNDLRSSYKNAFSRIISAGGGFSLYDNASAELYSDTFNDGIFQGKGLIDVKAYNTVMKNKLPAETVLSHDILEGGFLKTAYISDAQISDGCPDSATAYFSRAERWTRGDWQNLRFLFSHGSKSPGALTKYKLFDNVVRSLVYPVLALDLLLAAYLPRFSLLLTLTAISGVLLNPVLDCLRAALLHPQSTFRIYYSRTSVPVLRTLKSAFLSFLMIMQSAWYQLSATVRALFRMITKQKLLQWTVSADVKSSGSVLSEMFSFLPSFAAGAILVIFGEWYLKLIGLLFIFSFVITLKLQQADSHNSISGKACADSCKNEYLSYMRLHWNYFESFCTAEMNYLPPDNVTFEADGSVKHIDMKTSPTNIGFYLLSVYCAYRAEIIDINEMLSRLRLSLKSIDELPKYKGNLYNWYDIKDKKPIEPFYASSVDSGNFLCSLVALNEGLKALDSESTQELTAIIESLLNNTRFGIFYNEARGLLRTGIDTATDKGTDSHYDLFMSEMRMTSFYAVSSGSANDEHWAKIIRKEKHKHLHYGVLSWTGTAFEYFMSCIFLPTFEGSATYESLCYALSCQKDYCRKRGIPYGISESAYYEFDEKGGYKYKADGVPLTALKKSVGGNLAVSPYSSFLFGAIDKVGSLKNLSELEKYGALSDYGFYDAVDFTAERTGGTPQVVRTCMAHHIGMSILSAYNVLSGGEINALFMKNTKNAKYSDLLCEEI